MSARAASPFSPRAVLAIVVIGALSFLALLYFIGAGDTGNRSGDGGAHAASKGLNGYAALAQLLKAQGYKVTQSRSPTALETRDLLVLTPPMYTDAEELGAILEQRRYVGPTMVILPKWWAMPFGRELPEQLKGKVKPEWVKLGFASEAGWATRLTGGYSFTHTLEEERPRPARWSGLDYSGATPTETLAYAQPKGDFVTLVRDGSGKVLAFIADDYANGGGDDEYVEQVIFVAEPDLLNNYGLADPARAALALALVREAGYGEEMPVTFDLTLNGLGATQNLLTLAFRPPFLAATLCLIAALIVVGWRAFLRFGPARAEAPASAFGKSRLITSGARLVLRARRLPLLTAPYAELSARRLGRLLGLPHPTPQAIDEALRRRLPEDEPFSIRAEALRQARKPSEILGAAAHLHELERKLTR
ncbi:DUF4350 domain-containing protein [Altererythrobacter sp. BO-6]|uniref:DUF4350 domain-containing protein n=1 Tax=Altererythrobacter sp. BO-6 TaxID=2604537 RepID=UPI0013E118F7|nr:DUF4350 domain-containing protein [Altererythrobacter sp. BO-6]QIG53830.1 DUF4350 domain-containing protein [Altererythrobacter sp. BO-6]